MSRKPQYLLLLLAILGVGQALYGSWTNEWASGDEYWHYAWNERFYNTGESERASVSNFQSPMPITVLNVLTKKLAPHLGITDGNVQVFMSRLPGVLFLALLYGFFFLFVSRYFGKGVGLLATLFVVLDMNLVAHASLIAVDLSFALAAILAIWAFMSYADGERLPSLKRAALCGLAIGFAFSVKYTAVLLVLLAVPVLAHAALRLWRQGTPPKSMSRTVMVLVAHVGVAALVAILVINVAFGFKHGFFRLSSLTLYSHFFQDLAKTGIVMPFPEAFVSGLDMVLASERNASWNTVIAGHYYDSGVWYYFPLLWLLKTPITLVVGTMAAVAFLVLRPGVWRRDKRFLYILFCFSVFLGYFSFIFRTQVGYRYALMVVPLGAIIAAYGLMNVFPRPKILLAWPYWRHLGILAVVLALLETLPFTGNPLAFSNVLISPKKNAFKWLADSNLDWFQNHRRNRDIISKEYPGAALDPPHIVAGVNFFTINRLVGVWRNFEEHKWLRDRIAPFAHINHTFVGFDVTPTQFAQFISEKRTFSETETAKAICPDSAAFAPLVAAGEKELDLTNSGTNFTVGCVRVTTDTLIEIKGLHGYNRVGIYNRPGECGGENLAGGQSLWFLFKPGVFPVCVYAEKPAKFAWSVQKGEATIGPASGP